MSTSMTIEQWETAVALGMTVGECPRCRGPRFGEAPIESMGKVFLDSTCRDCGHQVTAPGGRSLAKRVVVPFRRRALPEVVRVPDYAERAAGDS